MYQHSLHTFPFMAICIRILLLYHNSFGLSLTCRYLGNVQFLAVINSTTVNVFVLVFFPISLI